MCVVGMCVYVCVRICLCAYMFVCMRMYTILLQHIAARVAVCCTVLQCVAGICVHVCMRMYTTL